MAGANFHTVYMRGGILLVECKACGRRSSLDHSSAPKIHQGNMEELSRAKFKCGNRQCGARQVRLYMPHNHEEAAMWLAGDPLPPGREA
jgi:hypothetical protein